MLEKHSPKNLWRQLAVLLIWLLVWQAAYWLVHQDLLLASPLQVIGRLAELALQADFWLATLFSILRIVSGFLLGVLAGTVLAVATARLAWLRAFFQPAIGAIRATPVASFIILTLVWLTSNRVVIFIVFLMVMPIIWANVTEGIRKTDGQLLEMAKVFRMSRGQVIRLVFLPSVSPFFVAAASTSLGLAWKAGIAAEVLSTPRLSLGGRLYDAKIYLQSADLLAFTLLIIVLSLVLEKILLRVLRRTEGYFHRHGRVGDQKDQDKAVLLQDRDDRQGDIP